MAKHKRGNANPWGGSHTMLKTVFPWLVLAVACISCEPINRYLNMEDDNWIEETGEALIEYKFHVPVDLTPSSPE